METKTQNPSPRTVAEIQARIHEERHRLLAEQNLAVSLEGQRIAPLEAGDDAALDRIEAQFAKCIERQARIEERIELLQKRHDEAVEGERNADLDAIAARANAAREEGERLIRTEYPKLAKSLGALLRKLKALDALIDEDNRTLGAAGRQQLAMPNDSRCTPSRRVVWTERVTVGPADDRHPEHQYAYALHCDSPLCNRLTKQAINPVDIDVERTEIIGGHLPEPLYACIKLPAAEPMPYIHKTLPPAAIPPAFFDTDEDISAEEMDAIRKKLTERA